MSKKLLPFIWSLAAGLAIAAQPDPAGPGEPGEGLANEQKHFLECLAYVYSPALWISYQDSLYFHTVNDSQARQLERMKDARSRYGALTDRQQRYAMVTKAITSSGVEANWRKKLLLPFSETNQNLTPTLNKEMRIVPIYKLLQRLGDGDALIQDGAGTVYFIMNFGRAADDAVCTNGLFIKEGEKTYTTQSGAQNTVEAFTSVGLDTAERSALARVSAQFRKEAALIKPAVVSAADRDEFDVLKARANDSNPYMQFLVAKAYLDGKGTQQDERLGMDWMRRAAANGSGDAKSYLDGHKEQK